MNMAEMGRKKQMEKMGKNNEIAEDEEEGGDENK